MSIVYAALESWTQIDPTLQAAPLPDLSQLQASARLSYSPSPFSSCSDTTVLLLLSDNDPETDSCLGPSRRADHGRETRGLEDRSRSVHTLRRSSETHKRNMEIWEMRVGALEAYGNVSDEATQHRRLQRPRHRNWRTARPSMKSAVGGLGTHAAWEPRAALRPCHAALCHAQHQSRFDVRTFAGPRGCSAASSARQRQHPRGTSVRRDSAIQNAKVPIRRTSRTRKRIGRSI